MGIGMVVDMVLCIYEIFYIWLQVVEQQVVGLKEEVLEEVKVGCVDLCDLLLVIIDGEDVCDFDDVVYCEKKCGGGWCLWVVIVDVSYYVWLLMLLDCEVCNCGMLVYFLLQVVLMLLEVFFNGLCLLNLQVDRLCMVCEMIILVKGWLIGYKFYEVVMSFYVCLIYIKVWYMLQGDQDLCE